MRNRFLGGLIAFLALAASLSSAPRDEQWRKVEAAEKGGLPKTAIGLLDGIINDCMAEHSSAEAVKAMGARAELEAEVSGGNSGEAIGFLKTEMEKATPEMRPTMEALLAHWYWDYYLRNRWRFMGRTGADATPGKDLATWDLEQILSEIDRHYSAALADRRTLKSTPIEAFDGLLVKGSAPDAYRPTLYDFLAYEALEFYSAGEQGATIGEDAIELDARDPIFDDDNGFLAWRPAGQNPVSPQVKAVRLYQELMEFHRGDRDRSAYLDADLARILYGRNIAVGEDKGVRYKAALQGFIASASDHECSARAWAALATQYLMDGEPAEARQAAQRGLARFPHSAGAILCANAIRQIESKSASVWTESTWGAPWPDISVTYRNVTRVHFRAVKSTFQFYLENTWRDPENRDQLLASPPTLEWSADLPETKDFKDRTERVPAPRTLSPGFYFIFASCDGSFTGGDSQVSLATVWVSDLALVLRSRVPGGSGSGLVTMAESGEPVRGAKVTVYKASRLLGPQTLSHTETDENGRFEFEAGDEVVNVLAEDHGQAVSSAHELYSFGRERKPSPGTRVVLFTDRALYRPGQTVSYSGVAVRFDTELGRYSVVPDEEFDIGLADARGREVARATQRTNDFGSFSGVFTAPREGLTGRMSLNVLPNFGYASFSVEEYKRPKFRVEIGPPADGVKLASKVTLKGSAEAYSGAAIGGATVAWRVERGAQAPLWCWWWSPQAPKAVAHGRSVTGADGSFSISFTADPDRSVPIKNEPVFTYSLFVDVTDSTGETRSATRTVWVGYSTLKASLGADNWQTPDAPVSIRVETRSIEGNPEPSTGTVAVYSLRQPAAVERGDLYAGSGWYVPRGEWASGDQAGVDSWELGTLLVSKPFKTGPDGNVVVPVELKAGIYRAMLVATDRSGGKATARLSIQVVDPRSSRHEVRVPDYLASPRWSVEPGETFTGVWGTGYDRGRALVELECDGRVLKRYWTAHGRTQEAISLPVTEAMRGGVSLCVTSVHDNRAYIDRRVIEVPWTNKFLTLKWEHFRSKLAPGEEETWTAVVTGRDARPAAAEMVATLYDASLDQFAKHSWAPSFSVFRGEYPVGVLEFQNQPRYFEVQHSWDQPRVEGENWTYRSYPEEIAGTDDPVVLSPFSLGGVRVSGGYRANSTLAGTRMEAMEKEAKAVMGSPQGGMIGSADQAELEVFDVGSIGGSDKPRPGPSRDAPDLSAVAARRNLNETAFFFPQLVSNAEGEIRMEFKVPEALTEWKFQGFAHDKDLRSGLLSGSAVTSKDIMVEPNPPRFLREGDTVEFTVKVSNATDKAQEGTLRLTFSDAATLAPEDAALGNKVPSKAFSLPPRRSQSFSWRITVPDGSGFLTYRAVGATLLASDGEEGFLPVLSRRVLVSESLPLPIRGRGSREFEFPKLLDSGMSGTIRSQSLTVEMTSQPAWCAVMALPYLMEFPYECSEQVFNRYYANVLAAHIAKSDPKIRRIFDLWKGTAALDSQLERNPDLKSIMLEETPWLLAARSEGEARRNVGQLFDENRLNDESQRALRKLQDRQQPDGLWSWFPNGYPSEFISLYITTGFGRLRHLGVDSTMEPAVRSLRGLDDAVADDYRRRMKRPNLGDYVPTYLDALYLYGRSFFLADRPVGSGARAAVDFLLAQARANWTKLDSLQSQAQLALALDRFGDHATALAIVASLKERSTSDGEMGMHWNRSGGSWWWHEAPIETQAVLIEAFDEVAHDSQSVEACKVWLLKQKQTESWTSTKATADAVYALLSRGSNLLGSDSLVKVSLGGRDVRPESVEPGTGYFEKRFSAAEITPQMGRVSVSKDDDGVSWGSIHWQYLEEVGKVTPHEGTPLQVTKSLFIRRATARGQVLSLVSGPLAVGDELVVRITVSTDRDMEFVHLRDQRGSGTEPVNVLSGYRFQGGLGYYESTRDTASDFFIDFLPKGSYVLEYASRVQLRGSYQTGIAEIQCMYAPEFNSHSESYALEVR